VGASGYIGGHLVSALIEKGFAVNCLVRPSTDSREIDFLRSLSAQTYVGDLLQMDPSVSVAFRGADTAVNLVGSVAPPKGQSLDDLHFRVTQALVNECLLQQVPRVLLVTALGTADDAKTKYQSTKWKAEQHVKASKLKSIIARPSLIVGRAVGRRDSKLIKRYCDLILDPKRPQVPLIEGGENKVQPLYVGDLAQALVALLTSDAYDGRVVELGGPEVITLRRLVEMLMSVLSVNKPIKNVPAPLARLAAFFCELVQNVPLVTSDQVTLSTQHNICRENRLQELTGGRSTPLHQALRSYAALSQQ
jgi:NADH dehydrogenase